MVAELNVNVIDWNGAQCASNLKDVVQESLLSVADYYSGGELEHLRERVEHIAGAFGQLITILCEKEAIDFSDVAHVLQDFRIEEIRSIEERVITSEG